ncbi:MAG: hypothetical protein KFW09_04230 [Oscillospiraceae bacterium]|nr:hypothetical protein [Oscillospiraceae bacterium]
MSNRIYLNNNNQSKDQKFNNLNNKNHLENRYKKNSSPKHYYREYYNKNNKDSYNNILKSQQSKLNNNNKYKNNIRKKRFYRFLIFKFIILICIIIFILYFLLKGFSDNYIKKYNSMIPSLEANIIQSDYKNSDDIDNFIQLYFSSDIIINKSDKLIPLHISNSWKNNFPISIEILSQNNIVLYKSGSIMPNQYLKEIPMIDNLEIGKNKVILYIYSYDINNKKVVGKIKKNIDIEIKN